MARPVFDDHTHALAGHDPAPPDDGSATAAYALIGIGFLIGCAILGWSVGTALRTWLG